MSLCRFCDDPAVVKVALSDGCFCFPADREQLLCAQHYVGATPLGSMEITEDYTVGEVFRAREGKS